MFKAKSSLHIAVDLTPLRISGENGGAKILAITLLDRFQKFAPDYRFLLLTAPWNHQELLEYNNQKVKSFSIANLSLERALPKNKIIRFLEKIKRKIKRKIDSLEVIEALKKHEIDLLFCPFSDISNLEKLDRNIPAVSLVHDLQHLDYPFLFSPEEQNHRTNFLQRIVNDGKKIICVSEFTKRSLIEHFNADPTKIEVIYNSIHDRLPILDPQEVSERLEKLKISPNNYAFYPANYWPHKNHRMLLTAYSIYQKQSGERPLDLVFTGSLPAEEIKLKEAAIAMGLEKNVHFLGFLPEVMLSALWQGCKCSIYPSLYEGFGIPVLEAMVFGKPVICSNVCSLPEVGGDAVLYFDPRKPEELASRLLEIDRNSALVDELVAKGFQRLELFDRAKNIEKYLAVFETVTAKC